MTTYFKTSVFIGLDHHGDFVFNSDKPEDALAKLKYYIGARDGSVLSAEPKPALRQQPHQVTFAFEGGETVWVSAPAASVEQAKAYVSLVLTDVYASKMTTVTHYVPAKAAA